MVLNMQFSEKTTISCGLNWHSKSHNEIFIFGGKVYIQLPLLDSNKVTLMAPLAAEVMDSHNGLSVVRSVQRSGREAHIKDTLLRFRSPKD